MFMPIPIVIGPRDVQKFLSPWRYLSQKQNIEKNEFKVLDVVQFPSKATMWEEKLFSGQLITMVFFYDFDH